MKPLRYSQQTIAEEDIAAVVRVLRSPYLTQGPEIEAFEAELAAYVGAKYAICVGSGTAALHLALMAAEGTLPERRLRPGQKGHQQRKVLTTPLSFVATANAALMAGFYVWFSDVDASTGNAVLVDDIVLPVHYAGRAATISPLCSLVVEDACHALGAMDFDGCSKVGSCAHSLATVFSFHPVKPITTGEGGAVTTNDAALAARIRLLRSHGRDENGQMIALGYNYRMTEMQAALGRSQLTRCDEMRQRRYLLTVQYWSEVAVSGTPVVLPLRDATSSWHLYPVRILDGRRDAVKAALNAQGIGAQVHYPPIHLQPYYRERFGYKDGDFPEAEAWGREELSLPLHAGMRESDVDRVCKALKEALS